MTLESPSLNECTNREIRHEPQSCFCTVSSIGQSQGILPHISSSLSPRQKPWRILLVRAGTHLPSSAELLHLSSTYSASSALRSLFMGLPLISEQKGSRRLESHSSQCKPEQKMEQISPQNLFQIFWFVFFPYTTPLWVEIFFNTCACDNYLKPSPMQIMVLVLVLLDSLHLYFSTCSLSEQGLSVSCSVKFWFRLVSPLSSRLRNLRRNFMLLELNPKRQKEINLS